MSIGGGCTFDIFMSYLTNFCQNQPYFKEISQAKPDVYMNIPLQIKTPALPLLIQTFFYTFFFKQCLFSTPVFLYIRVMITCTKLKAHKNMQSFILSLLVLVPVNGSE